ncbi:hypothetical protein PSN45_001760 [Yamadazyma tenuis]|uniref:Trafficking protein particle complex subunit n=1 Tax=Candida tenuis (strain ATCC 10573 / BCRC 21748 / CBS 615 / JCM 9827 / NBRC 10315 / NRRL Y-1498 / VKM Y-70) TaxID=590646 RepID=G3BE86_CANTC|nr:snare-like protein [Yamadazyma tenuis ATCC 10573]EGV60486.1 snare-like protein [Yamadazyma tenuis ATCC 10573]WEJ94276.1 hypothetical protein PSN45_001760 [Yamadazyma tenuis]
MLYSFYIFDRHCNCIYHRRFSLVDDGATNTDNESDVAKLLFGVLYSLKNISSKLGDQSTNAGGFNYLKSFSTSSFRIHFLETLSNLKFVLITDNLIDNVRSVLWELYSTYYLNNIALNPLSPVDFKGDEKITNPNFISQTDQFLRSLPVYGGQ